MARCEICGKGPEIGRRVSFSGQRNKRKRSPNIQRVRILYQGRKVRMKVCTRCIKSGRVVKVV